MKFITIETTFSNLAKAKEMAKILLEKKLAACIQFQEIESMYIWQEKLHDEKEILLSIKTKNSLFDEIAKTIQTHHEYELPQIIAKEITNLTSAYSSWLLRNIK